MDLDQEQKLVERAKTDGSAFGMLYDAYYLKILNYVLRRTANIEVAEDITAEVFIKALNSIKRFTWKGAPFSAWLYRIASNEIASYFRHKHTKNVSLDTMMEEYGFVPVSDEDIELAFIESQEEIERHKQFLLVQQALIKLPPKYQEALSLKYFEKKTIAEIAIIMDKRPGTIKSLLSRGIDKLRKALSNTERNLSAQETFIKSGDKKS